MQKKKNQYCIAFHLASLASSSFNNLHNCGMMNEIRKLTLAHKPHILCSSIRSTCVLCLVPPTFAISSLFLVFSVLEFVSKYMYACVCVSIRVDECVYGCTGVHMCVHTEAEGDGGNPALLLCFIL